MAITKTRAVVNAVNLMKDGWTDASGVFIDRLKDGRRSLKVWGWGDEEYILAVQMLEQMGCKVEVHTHTVNRYFEDRLVTRLHITE